MTAMFAKGFADLDREVAVESLPVIGTVPTWLSGALLRTAPAKFDLGRQTVNHWFDGLAMLHRFAFRRQDLLCEPVRPFGELSGTATIRPLEPRRVCKRSLSDAVRQSALQIFR
jgi:hypothetical protein